MENAQQLESALPGYNPEVPMGLSSYYMAGMCFGKNAFDRNYFLKSMFEHRKLSERNIIDAAIEDSSKAGLDHLVVSLKMYRQDNPRP